MYDRPIAFHREFVVLTGSITAALFLSQACYWAYRAQNKDGTNPDGWFYKSRVEWAEETGMSRREQETARKRLKELGIIRESRRGKMNPTVWFWVDLERLDVMVKVAYENQAAIAEGGIRPQVMAESAHSCGANPTSDIRTEITPEITRESADLPEQIDPVSKTEGMSMRDKVLMVTDIFQLYYEKHHGKKPPWSKADFALAQRQIKSVGTAKEVVLCVTQAWVSTDPYLRKIRTSFKSLMSDDSIQQLLAIVRGDRMETRSIEELTEAQDEAYG